MMATVVYLQDGLPQTRTFQGEHIIVHIHADPGPHKRGYVRVDGVEHHYGSVVEIERADA